MDSQANINIYNPLLYIDYIYITKLNMLNDKEKFILLSHLRKYYIK